MHDRARHADEIERSTLAFRRFLGLRPTDTVEIAAFGGRHKIQVAYVRSVEEHLRLLIAAEGQPEMVGSYQVFNLIHEGLYARIGENRWVPGAPRTSDCELTELRAVYIDFDAKRPRGISATDAEKQRVRDVASECKAHLAEVFGAPDALGLGDSGNGYALFVALEPIAPSRETTAKVQRFLKAISSRFTRPGVEIDPAVCNPSRLCPAFGTLKRKGVDCQERPWRTTSFRCADTITRVPLAAF